MSDKKSVIVSVVPELLSLPILWGSSERLKQFYLTLDSLAYWAFNAAWIGWMADVDKGIFGGDCRDGFI